MISNFFHSHSFCVLVWTDVEILGVAEGANGVVVDTRITDAILQV